MTQTPPQAHAPAGTSWVHCLTLIALAQVSDGDVKDALLAGARALCRKQIHRERNKASRKAKGLPEYRTPDGVADALLGNPPLAGLGSGGAEVLEGGTGVSPHGGGGAEAATREHGEIMELMDDAFVELRRLARPGAFGEGSMAFLCAMERLARRTGREPILKGAEA